MKLTLMLLAALAFAAIQQTHAQGACTPQMRAAGFLPCAKHAKHANRHKPVCVGVHG